MKSTIKKLISSIVVMLIVMSFSTVAFAATSVNGVPDEDVNKTELKRLKEIDKYAEKELKEEKNEDDSPEAQAFYDHVWYETQSSNTVTPWNKKIYAKVGMYVTDYWFPGVHVVWDGYGKGWKESGSPTSPNISCTTEVWVTGLGVSFSGMNSNWTAVSETLYKRTTSGSSSTGVSYTGFTADGILWDIGTRATSSVYVGGTDYTTMAKRIILF